MTNINDIITDNWDSDIVTIPDVINGLKGNRRLHGRVISTELNTTLDNIEGITGRRHFSPDSHDAYVTFVEAATEADTRLIIKAIKKICATYKPVSGQENILQWSGGEWDPFNDVRFMFRFILIIRKSGIAAY